MTRILVTGGTGTLGRLVTERLRADGHEVRVLSRHAQVYAVDLREGGIGLDAAVTGVDAIVHCATSPRGGDERAAERLIAPRAGRPSRIWSTSRSSAWTGSRSATTRASGPWRS